MGDTPGEATFRVRARPDGRPSADGQGSLLARSPAHAGHGHIEVTVPVTTLDDFFADARGRPCALWVDVEGATTMVLAGAAHVLADTQVLIVEVEERSIWDGQAMRADVVDLLGAHGLVPIARDFRSRYQCNLVFVRHELRHSDHVKASLRA